MPLPGRVDLHLSPGHHQAPDRRSESRSDVQAIAPAASAWIVRRPALLRRAESFGAVLLRAHTADVSNRATSQALPPRQSLLDSFSKVKSIRHFIAVHPI